MDSKEIRNLMEAYSEVYVPQQLDESEKLNELSDRKLRAYVKKSEKSHQDLNKKWDQGTATYKDKYKSINREYGQERALKRLNKEGLDIFDVVLEFLQAEGYAETLEEAEWMMANLIDEEAIQIITELTGGKGHPGYKAGSKDHGPMQSGHPTDTFKRTMKGGTMSQRHGDHLGDLDDDDDDDDGLEAALKDTARKKRENVRKPLRNKVKAARKVLSKEEFASWLDEAMSNYDKNRKRAAQRAAARNEARAQGKTGAIPGVGYVTPRKERETWTDESGKTRHAKGL